MNWKFWQRILRIDDGKIKFPLAWRMFDGLDSVRDVKLTPGQRKIEALRAKVAEYAGKIEGKK